MATISVYTDYEGVKKAQKGKSFIGFKEPKHYANDFNYYGFCINVPVESVEVNSDGEIFVLEKERW